MRLENSIENLFASLNKTLCESLDRRTFICFAMGEVNVEDRILRQVNVGCPPLYHFRAATGEVSELKGGGYPLGVRAARTYQAVETQLEPGDRIVFCSDGIIEAANEAVDLFGFEQTAEVIRQGCTEGLSAEALVEHIFDRVQAFAGEAPQGDDMTVVVLQVEG